MNNYGSKFLLILIVIAASAWQWADRGLRYGLDLAGGAALTYRIDAQTSDGAARDFDVNTILEIIENRVNAFGLAEISLTATEDDEILVEVPGRSKEQLEGIKRVVERNGDLEFRILENETKTRAERQKREQLGRLYRPSDPRYVWVPDASGRDDLLVLFEEKPVRDELDALRARAEAGEDVAEAIKDAERRKADIERLERFTGQDLAKTAVQPQNVEIVVYFEMIRERQDDFHGFTKRHVEQQMAIILDGKVNSAPVINSPLPGKGIIEGGGMGGFKADEARELSIVLESGATGVTLTLVREDLLGPSLGADAIETGQWSVIAGFVIVLLIMLALYRVPGLIANLALLMNVVILLGALAFFGAALTLAGIAGIVLTLGMAVDANILIFERLREERQRGKSVVEALAAGYDRAIVAIVDANVTTVLTAIVLIVMGSGTVKGFGYTLTIGIIASMFTAIYVTRAVFEWGISTGVMKRLGFARDRRVPTLDYMRFRKWFTGPSIVLMIVGMGVFLARDEAESKDLEFVGGQQVIVQLEKPVSRSELLGLVAGGGFPEIAPQRLQPRGVEVQDDQFSNRWQLRVALQDRAEGERFVAHVESTLAGRLVADGLTDFSVLPSGDGGSRVTCVMRALQMPEGVTADLLTRGIADYVEPERDPPFSDVKVTPVDGGAFRVSVDVPATEDPELFVKDNLRLALQRLDEPVFLSDPLPSVSFLNPGRAEELSRQAIQAVLLAMLLQVVYIRLRFADFKHGFAAVCALIHDVTITLGIVAVCDASGLVHAKINLVLIAAFLTLIGYSMNDTIIVFDRIRENLGKSKVIRSTTVNDGVNQTLIRSIRTSVTTWVVVALQFALNYGSGSVLEGFAFVMVIGVISGSYSSIFIAGPLLLFLPDYWRKLSANRTRLWIQIALTGVGIIVGITSKGHGVGTIAGVLMAANIPIHFLLHFVPWLRHEDPDALLEPEITAEEEARPLHKPGI